MERDLGFWRVYLGCAREYTSVPELAELYGLDASLFYGESGTVKRMEREGALEVSRRLKTTYRSDFSYLLSGREARVLEHYAPFFSHAWLRKLVPDPGARASRAGEIFHDLREAALASFRRAGRMLFADGLGEALEELASGPAPEERYPRYLSCVRTLDLVLHLHSMLFARELLHASRPGMDGFPEIERIELPFPEEGVTEDYLDGILERFGKDLREEAAVKEKMGRFVHRGDDVVHRR